MKRRTMKATVIKSGLALLMCLSMFIGSTFAWFTDQVSGATNIIQSGSLDIEMQWAKEYDGEDTVWKNAAGANAEPVFDYENWEPGYSEVRYIKVSNEGNLAFKWLMSIIPTGIVGKLAEAIEVRYDIVSGNPHFVEPTADNKAGSLRNAGMLTDVINGEDTVVQGVLLPEGKEAEGFYSGEIVVCVTLHMQEISGNEFQGEKVGDAFTVLLKATQYSYEYDSFDNKYDKEANYPYVVTDLELSAGLNGKVDENNRLTEEIVLTHAPTGITAVLPVGTIVEGDATQLTLKITEDGVDANVTLDTRVGYDVVVEGVAHNNDKPIVISIPKALPANQIGTQLFHAGKAMAQVYSMEALSQKDGNNDTYGDKYIYDANSGNVFFSLIHFSNVSMASTETVNVLGEPVTGITINLNTPGDWLKDGVITVPADGNTYILTYNSGDMSKSNSLSQTITHGWYNLNPGTFSETPIKVEMGAKVVLKGVNIRTTSGVDAIQIVSNPDSAKKYTTTTQIDIADGTQNWVTGRSGIGFGGNWDMTDVWIEGYGNLYATAIGANCAAIGVSDQNDGDHHKMHFNVSHLRAIPMNNSAGIGSGGNSWRTLSLVEFNGNGLYQIYRGGNAASVGSGLNSDRVGEIIFNDNVRVHCYPQPWTAFSRDLGAGIYAGICDGIYIGENATVSEAGIYVPSGRQKSAEVIVKGFTKLDKIVSATSIEGELTEVVAKFGNETVKLDVSKCSYNGTKVSVAPVYKDGVVYYLNRIQKTSADVHNISINSIEVSGYKPTYYVGGEGLDITKLVLTVTYGEGKPADITEGFDVTGFDSTTAGEKTVTVTYKGKTTTFKVNVVEVAPATAKITTEPAKTEYFVGEALNLNGLVIEVTNNNGSSYTVIDSFNVSGFDSNVAGTQTVTVTITDDIEVSFTVDVIARPESLKVESNKTEYTVGDDLDITVTVNYDGGEESKTITSADYTLEGNDMSTAGEKTITVTYTENGKTVSATVTVIVVAKSEFLYRVGNQNAVTKKAIAKMLTGEEVDGYDIKTVDGNASYNSSKFTGTGIVKATIGGKDYFLEVVNAENTTTGNIRNSGLLNGKNFVLLCDVEYTEPQTITMEGSTIYGNGFKYDFSKFTPQASELDNVFVIHMKNATLDNVKIIGKVYTDGAYVYKTDSSADRENYMSLLFATGDSKILNCYVSGTRAPVRVEGNVTIENTTLAGGNVANIDVKGGVLTLNNVTTINQGTNPVGYGIFMDNDAGKDEDGNLQPITININGLTSYNWLTASDVNYMDDKASKKPMPTLLNSVFADANFAGAEAVNFKVVCLNELASVTVNGLGDPIIASISGNNGRLWCEKGSLVTAPDYKSDGTGTIPPVFTWSEYSATTEFTKGGSVTFNADLLTAQKYGQNLEVIVSCTGGTLNGKKITFNTAGTYTITYAVTDSYNYRLNANGDLEQYSESYTFSIVLTVNETEPQTKHAEIKIAGSDTTIVEKNGKKYVVANSLGGYTDASKTDNTFGFKYPEVTTLMSDGINGQHSDGYKACYPIFEAVEITDYANGGLGDPVTYNSSTQTLPSGLKYVNDRDLYNAYSNYKLSYQATSNGDTTNGSVVSGKLCFTSPSVTKNRSEHFTWIEYSYKDNAGETYYFVIGYRAQAQTYKASGCFTGDTLVVLGDGSTARIDSLKAGDVVMSWNAFTGKLEAMPVSLFWNHGDDIYNVISLSFSNGKTLDVVTEHGFFDATLNKYVYINAENYNKYIGHKFACLNDNGVMENVVLLSAEYSRKWSTCYSLRSACNDNVIVDGFLTLTIEDIPGFLTYFEFGEGYMYDAEKLQQDIETYGLYTYDDWKDYVSYEEYVALNGQYLKIVIGKGYLTYNDILGLIAGMR